MDHTFFCHADPSDPVQRGIPSAALEKAHRRAAAHLYWDRCHIGIAVTVLTTGLRAVLLLLWMMEEQRSRYLQQEVENAHARQQILMMQMRPHFIYNTMMSIYYLCDSDPKEAQRVCGNFTTYLQGTFTALGDGEPIPFTRELQHAQAYLAVEQARYPDLIVLEYDTPHTAFTLPALTLQPWWKTPSSTGSTLTEVRCTS